MVEVGGEIQGDKGLHSGRRDIIEADIEKHVPSNCQKKDVSFTGEVTLVPTGLKHPLVFVICSVFKYHHQLFKPIK